MHISSAVFGLSAFAVAVHGALLPRVTAAPRYEGLVGRSDPAQDGLCGILGFCQKTDIVTTTASTTTTLAPSTVIVTVTSSTSTTVTATASVTGTSCITGSVGIWDVMAMQRVGYLTSSPPYISTSGVTYETALKVSADWVAGVNTHHNVQAIGQANPYFGLASPDATGASISLAVVLDSSGASSLPVVDFTGNAYESNIWSFQDPSGNYKMIAPGWTDASGAQTSTLTWWDPSTGDVTVSNTPLGGQRLVVLTIVTPDMVGL